MIFKECPAYDENIEIQKKYLGNTEKGPIYSEKEVVVSEYCSLKKEYTFSCDQCPIYIDHIRKGEKKAEISEEEKIE